MAKAQRKPLIKSPSSRQVKAAKLVSENLGKDKPQPIGEILLEAGYSEAVALTPSIVTRSQGFQLLMDKMGATDDRLAEVLTEGLNATKVVVMGKDEDSFADVQPDYTVRHRYLETGLRLKGLGKSEGTNITFNGMVVQQRTEYPL